MPTRKSPINSSKKEISQILVNDKCLYGFKGKWEEGIFKGFYNPQQPEMTVFTGNFSYFEIEVNGKIKRGYGWHQIKF